MANSLEFKRKILLGFLAAILAAVSICVVALYSLHINTKTHDVIISDYIQDLIASDRLRANEEEIVASSRGHLFTGDTYYLDKMLATRKNFLGIINELKIQNQQPKEVDLLRKIETADIEYQHILNLPIQARKTTSDLRSLIIRFERDVQPRRLAWEQAVLEYNIYS